MNILNKINKLTVTHPLSTTIFLVLFMVTLTQLAAVLLTNLLSEVSQEAFDSYIRYTASALMLGLLWKWDILRDCGVTQPLKKWHPKWPLALFPMLLIGGLNVTAVDWANVEFSAVKSIGWIFDNIATGLFEEVMMRAMAFYLLFRAWRHQNNAIYKAAIVQALIFGLLHLINLRHGFSVDVVAQVIYATILGFAFAGVVAFTRSVWPAVFAHAFINAMSNINPTFVTDYVNTPNTVAMYGVFISIILLVTALPGYFMLRSSDHSLTPVNG